MVLSSAYQLFLVDHEVYCTEKTMIFYRENVSKFINYLSCQRELLPDQIHTEEITRDQVLAFQTFLVCSGIKHTSVNTYFRATKTFLNYCIDEGFCDPDVLRKVKFLKSDQQSIVPLSVSEVDDIEGLFNSKTESGLRNLCIIHLMLDAGFRMSDVVNLMVSNVSFTNNYLLVKGKGNKFRTVLLCPKLKKMLSHYQIRFRLYTPGSDTPFFTKVGSQDPLSIDCIKQLFARIKRSSGISRVHPHLLRHTFATSYMVGGGNLEFLRLMLGHEDYDTTKRYLHLAQVASMLQIDIYKLDPVFFKSGY